jgi:N6-L-threonylcarbamoyladenine synthase
VARNLRLRERLAQDPVLRALRLVLPPLALCSDNGAMIAGLAHIRWRKGERDPLELDAIATPQAGGKVQMR